MEQHSVARGRDERIKGRFKLAIILTGTIFLVEVAGGYITNSLALATDAAHVFMDLFALSVSLLAVYLSEMPPTEKRTYGWHRIEVFASFMNGFLLIFVSLVIFYKAYLRFLDPPPVKGLGVIVVATAGLIINLVVAYRLHHDSKHDLNIKSAFFHVAGDAIASVGVIIGGVVIHLTGLFFVDPIISALIGIIIIVGALRIVLESSHILLEGAPRGLDLNRVVHDIEAVEGVKSIHSLHLWTLCSNSYAFSAHIDTDAGSRIRQREILSDINDLLARRFNIHYTTLQMECM
ncbi:MAG: cation diffusion facilitator family transporter, partial [Thermodesulfobacteriota bacterium]